MPRIDEIKDKDWSLDIARPGEVVSGLNDIAQCILIICLTVPGSDPLRPDFGCGAFTYIDKPVTIAIPNMIREMARAIRIYEPRADVVKIQPISDVESVKFVIYWTPVGGNETQQTAVNYG